ncbi:MAG: hypothetical protein ACOX5G_06870 [Kiritimatiellia bacterium]|jgi:hypothetical protein
MTLRNRPSLAAPILLAAGLAAVSAVADGTLFTPSNFDALRVDSVGTAPERITAIGAPGGLFFPGEPVTLSLELRKPGGEDVPLAIELQAIHTRVPNKDTTRYIDPFGHPDKVNLEGAPLREPVTGIEWDENGKATKELALKVPERYATYCVILVKGEGNAPADRVLLGSFAVIPRDRDDATADNTPVFGEGQMQAFVEMGRMGIRATRCEISWNPGLPPEEFDWSGYDALNERLAEGKLKAMFTLGGCAPSRYGIPWAGPGIPAAVQPAWDGNPYWGQCDWGCAPEHFEEYGRWVKAYARRYWKDGDGTLWGFENYNEPWEGGGISGYARDCVSWRDWQRILARVSREVSPDIKICGACSIMNTEDKLYSEGPRPDGTFEGDEMIDVFTDHYVTPSMAYGPMVAEQHGKFSIENETWLVISEYLLPQVMCQWMAAGQRAVACWHPQVLFQEIHGVRFPTTVPLATAAFNHFVTGLRFNKLVFQDHLPWLFQFGEDDDPDGVVVMIGQLLTRGGPTPQDNPSGRLWGQVDSVDGGTITVENARAGLFGGRTLRFYDAAANEIHKGEATVTLPLDMQPVYIRSGKGPAAVAEAFRKGVIEGKYPAEILPRDFTQRIADGLVLRVDLANRLNAPISGTFSATAPEGFVLARDNVAVELAAGERKTIELPFAKVDAGHANQYPFQFVFDTDHGRCAYGETLYCTAVPRATPSIDGDLSDWDGLPGIVMAGAMEGVNPDELARRPWLRLEDFPEGSMMVDFKLAWDAGNIYVAARVMDSTPEEGKVRMATRNDDDWFHSAASDNEEPWKSWLEKNAPGQSFAQVPYIYKRAPWGIASSGDNLQLAFNVIPGYGGLGKSTDVPFGFHAVADTDYEFCAYLCGDGEPEFWRLLAPGMPRVHSWPRQPLGGNRPAVLEGGVLVVRQDGNVRTYEAAIPQSALPELALEAGTTFRFAFKVGNNAGPKVSFGDAKAVCKDNGLTLHPYWEISPSCDVEWKLVD